MKFGGTSVGSSDAMKSVINIITKSTIQNIVVVVSALSGVTDYLLKVLTEAPNLSKELLSERIVKFRLQHLKLAIDIIKEERLRIEAENRINELIIQFEELCHGIFLIKEVTQKIIDEGLSYGEILSSTILAYGLRSRALDPCWVNAGDFIRTDSSFGSAIIDFNISNQAIKEKLEFTGEHKIYITQGFIGTDMNNRITTLGRGGSDYSAAVIGSAIGADEIQIWTDVDGVMSADPRIVENPHTIGAIPFEAMREISFFGAKVLHTDTIKPAVQKQIPVRILNTFNPTNPGTVVYAECPENSQANSVLVIKNDCWHFKIDTNGSGQNINNYIERIINLSGILDFHSSGGYISIVTEESSLKEFQSVLQESGLYHTTSPVSIILLSYNKPFKQYNILTDLLVLINPYQFYLSPTGYSLQFLVGRHNTNELTQSLHEFLLSMKT